MLVAPCTAQIPYRKLRAWAFWGRLIRGGGIIRAKLVEAERRAAPRKKHRHKLASVAHDGADEPASPKAKSPKAKGGDAAKAEAGMTVQVANQLLAAMAEMKRELLDAVDLRLAERLDERLDEYESDAKEVQWRGDWLAA